MWKPNTEAVWATIKYAVSTGRLEKKQEVRKRGTEKPDEFDVGEEVSVAKNED